METTNNPQASKEASNKTQVENSTEKEKFEIWSFINKNIAGLAIGGAIGGLLGYYLGSKRADKKEEELEKLRKQNEELKEEKDYMKTKLREHNQTQINGTNQNTKYPPSILE